MVIVEDEAEMPSVTPAAEPFLPALPTPGRSIAGIDGCRAGWVIVRRNEDGRFDAPIVVARRWTICRRRTWS